MANSPLGTFLPLTALKDFSAYLDFLAWLQKNNQSVWLMLPISAPVTMPYRGDGIGYDDYFLSASLPKKSQTYLFKREDFISQNKFWLEDFAVHQALSEHFGTKEWWTWPAGIKEHQRQALLDWKKKLSSRIDFFIDRQYFLANQFALLHQEARKREITLMGDLPFYLSQESSLVWAHQKYFLLRRHGELEIQSGVPALKDEPFAAQFWGHPLYNWQEAGTEKIMQLFTWRLSFLAQFFDTVRIDHANGFFRYGIMYPQNPKWSKKVAGPGKKALNILLNHCQTLDLGVFFENIGSQTMRLEQYMKEKKVIGMSVLTLAYNLDATLTGNQVPTPKCKQLALDQYKGKQVIFTSTHDTMPLLTWLKMLPAKIKTKFLLTNNLSPDLSDEQLLKKILHSLASNQSSLLIVPWQDWQGETFRFNVPGREDLNNWTYRVPIEKFL